MKYFVLAALLSKTTSAQAAKAGDPCATAAACGDPNMCCGVATNGFVTDSTGKPTAVPVTNNLAVCNLAPGADGKPIATDWTGEFINADKKIAYEFKGLTDFVCFDSVVPPTPPPTPTPFPIKGAGKMCTGMSDTCDDDKGIPDKDLCCGIAMNGLIVDDKGVTTGMNVLSAALCNKIPDADGKPQAMDIQQKWLGGDNKTEFSIKYTGKDFKCFSEPAPPSGDQPAPPKNADANVGGFCVTSDDCRANVTDNKDDYCCGAATNGKLLDGDGNPVASSKPENAIICGKSTAIDVQAGYKTPEGTQVTIAYPASGFTCLKSAQALVASAAVLLSAVAMF